MNPFKLITSFGVFFCIFAVALVLAYYAPQPWKFYGLSVVLVYLSATLVMRATQVIIGDFSLEWLVYILATVIPMVLVALYAPAPYGPITMIVFLALNALITYYWLIAIGIDEAKKLRRKRLDSPQSK